MDLKWFGVASLSISENGRGLLIDPFFNRNKDLYKPSMEKYASYDSILITHGHFDHIEDIPRIYVKNPAVKIYCTQIVKTTLTRLGVNKESITLIKPGDSLNINGFDIDVYQGKHIDIDFKMIIDGAFKFQTYVHFDRLIKFTRKFKTFPENNEIVSYHIKSTTNDVFVMGSMNLNPEVNYPTGVNNLVLPYQGNSHILEDAPAIIKVFEPDTVILDHFDDGFPPTSQNINTDLLINKMSQINPELSIFRPIAGARYHLDKVESINAERCNFAVWDNYRYSLG